MKNRTPSGIRTHNLPNRSSRCRNVSQKTWPLVKYCRDGKDRWHDYKTLVNHKIVPLRFQEILTNFKVSCKKTESRRDR